MIEETTPKLKDADLKKEWVEELRSGRFKQGRERLKTAPHRRPEPEYCCLGVLGEILCRRGMAEWSPVTSGHSCGLRPVGAPLHMNAYGDLPATLANEIGLDPEVEQELIRYNDGEKWSFEQIADFIEENL